MKKTILAFKKTSEFPKQGSIIQVDAEDILSHIAEIELSRDSENMRLHPIVSKLILTNSQNFPEMPVFYSTEIERKFNTKTKIPLKVHALEFFNNRWWCKCELEMLACPIDVYQDKFVMWIDANDAEVVYLRLCEAQWVLSDKKPDADTQFGFKHPANNGLWIVFTEIESPKYGSNFENFIISLGLKEWSNVIESTMPIQVPEKIVKLEDIDKFDKLADDAINQIENSISNDDSAHNELDEVNRIIKDSISHMTKEVTQDDIFWSNPMSTFTERLFNNLLQVLNAHKIQITADCRNHILDEFKKITIISTIDVGFLDDDLQE